MKESQLKHIKAPTDEPSPDSDAERRRKARGSEPASIMEELAPVDGKVPLYKISGTFKIYEEDESHKGETLQEELADKSQENRSARLLSDIRQTLGII